MDKESLEQAYDEALHMDMVRTIMQYNEEKPEVTECDVAAEFFDSFE